MEADGTISVEGLGTPFFAPGSARFVQMQQVWDNWSGLILGAASAHGVPPTWILAVICQETGLWSGNPQEQATKVAPDGGLGLMQIMPATARAFGSSPEAMLDPQANIDVGVALLAKLSEAHGGELPEIVANYNAGGVRCGSATNPWNMVMSGDYAGDVVRWVNSAVMYLDLSPRRGPLLAGLAVGGAGLYAAAVIAGVTQLPRFLRR